MIRSKVMFLWLIATTLIALSSTRGETPMPLGDVQEVLAGYQAQMAAIHQRAAEESQALRQRTIAQLQALQDKYCRNAQLDEAIAVREQIRRMRAEQELVATVTPVAVMTTPPSPYSMRGRVGESFVCRVTGQTSGALWGTDVYTDDSDLATAAVHAGVLRDRESGPVKVTLLGPLSSYQGSSRNGVSSSSWSSWGGSFRVESVDGWRRLTTDYPISDTPDPSTLVSMATMPGQTFVFNVTGTTDGYLWGSEIYTTDSKLSTAAVHAGVLQPGQTGRIRVTILPGRASYPGVERHGVTSHEWASYPLSYSMRRE